MIETLTTRLTVWQEDPSIRAVVIRAAPSKAFCAGGDIRWIYDQRGHLNTQMEFFEREYRLNQLIHDYPKPYIALMDGITMGGGVGIGLHGSHPVASERFVCAMPETTIGFFPDIGGSYLLSRCPGYFGVYLGLTGERLSAVDAYGLGLVKARVLSEDFPHLLTLLQSTDLVEAPFQAVDACLEKIAQPEQEAPWLSRQTTIDACFGLATIALINQALLEANQEWCSAIRTDLMKKSPLSLNVTLQQLRLARTFDLEACLKMDRTLVRHFLQDHDFYEGVRALVVDKDQQPQWQPAHWEEVTADSVQHYFS
jgi:enoyl-CoA hydratase/carnithine racemase